MKKRQRQTFEMQAMTLEAMAEGLAYDVQRIELRGDREAPVELELEEAISWIESLRIAAELLRVVAEKGRNPN